MPNLVRHLCVVYIVEIPKQVRNDVMPNLVVCHAEFSSASRVCVQIIRNKSISGKPYEFPFGNSRE